MGQSYVWVVSWDEPNTYYGCHRAYKVFMSKTSALDFKYRLINEGYRNVVLDKRFD